MLGGGTAATHHLTPGPLHSFYNDLSRQLLLLLSFLLVFKKTGGAEEK